MATLVLNAPKYQANANGKRSYQNTLKTGIGTGYALNSNIRSSVAVGDEVLLLDKSSNQAAKGSIVKLHPTGVSTGNGIPRFDIHVKDLVGCPYVNVPLNRNGVAVI